MVNPWLHPRTRHRPFRRDDARPLLRHTYDRQPGKQLACIGEGQLPANSTPRCIVARTEAAPSFHHCHWPQLKALFADAERNSTRPNGLRYWSEDPEPPFRSISGGLPRPPPGRPSLFQHARFMGSQQAPRCGNGRDIRSVPRGAWQPCARRRCSPEKCCRRRTWPPP